MESRRLRATVSEEAYAISARVLAEEFRSDTVANAYRISERLRARGRVAEVTAEPDGVVVRLPLGDAPEQEFERAADDLLEAASW